jgi:dTDP-3-amino-3,4,6-trideoxy-alpha-D-glucose transaminase
MTTMQVPFVDLHAQHASIRGELERAVADVMDRGDFILGAAVERFERAFADYIGVGHAIGVGTGLSAIELALRAFDIGPGDEVITAANTFIATALAILAVGARPVFAEIDPSTHTIDPRALSAAITSRTRAVVPVHLFGRPADMDAILGVARRHDLVVVEDAAQAHGARYKGARAGTFGHAATFSFYPSKNLGACGDAGMVVTNDEAVAARIRLIGNYGQRVKYHHVVAGTNSRLDTLQAAILHVKLAHLDEWNAARRRHAALYDARLRGVVTTPKVDPDVEHVYHVYAIETDDRDRLQRALRERGVNTIIHYPIPAHLQEVCAPLGWKAGDFPIAEAAAARLLSLPMYAELTDAHIEYVAQAIEQLIGTARAR